MTLDKKVIKEIAYPEVMDQQLVERWSDGIPVFSENDPSTPEWKATPTFPLDLSSEGYGLVYIKNEADKKSNPTQTIKDRAAWELACLFRDYAKLLYLKKRENLLNGNISSLAVPRLSLITAGNVGKAISNMFQKYDLPPIKILVDSQISKERLEILKKLHVEIYMTDLSIKPLTSKEIKKLTNNEKGIDITSVKIFEPHAIFYDWHVHEAFNERPDEIYVPYGSGRLMENYITWQFRNARKKDPRLMLQIGKVIDIDIFGAEPKNQNSIADKLIKSYNPFTIFDDQDISALTSFSFTGKNTRIYRVSEERIKQAYQILSKYCDTEPSASVGLALYLQRFDEGKIDSRKKILIVNTGKGI